MYTSTRYHSGRKYNPHGLWYEHLTDIQRTCYRICNGHANGYATDMLTDMQRASNGAYIFGQSGTQ